MKKLIGIVAALAMVSNVAMANLANGKGSAAPKNDKGTELPKNDKGSVVPPVEIVDEMCAEIGYEFGPGDLTCNRNWFVCTEADGGADYICNVLPELPVNVLKIPLNAIEEGVTTAAHCVSEAANDLGPLALLVAVPCLGYGMVSGAAEGVAGTLMAFFEVTGDSAVLVVAPVKDSTDDYRGN